MDEAKMDAAVKAYQETAFGTDRERLAVAIKAYQGTRSELLEEACPNCREWPLGNRRICPFCNGHRVIWQRPVMGAPLFDPTPFVGASGLPLGWKVECDAMPHQRVHGLSDLDWQGLAKMASELFEWGTVHGVPRGGLPLAEAMRIYSVSGAPPVVVDDVWTTGGSMHRFCEARGLTGCRGLVAFARSPTPSWCTPVWRLTQK